MSSMKRRAHMSAAVAGCHAWVAHRQLPLVAGTKPLMRRTRPRPAVTTPYWLLLEWRPSSRAVGPPWAAVSQFCNAGATKPATHQTVQHRSGREPACMASPRFELHGDVVSVRRVGAHPPVAEVVNKRSGGWRRSRHVSQADITLNAVSVTEVRHRRPGTVKSHQRWDRSDSFGNLYNDVLRHGASRRLARKLEAK